MDDIQSVKELNGDIFLKFAHNICSLQAHLGLLTPTNFFCSENEGCFGYPPVSRSVWSRRNHHRNLLESSNFDGDTSEKPIKFCCPRGGNCDGIFFLAEKTHRNQKSMSESCAVWVVLSAVRRAVDIQSRLSIRNFSSAVSELFWRKVNFKVLRVGWSEKNASPFSHSKQRQLFPLRSDSIGPSTFELLSGSPVLCSEQKSWDFPPTSSVGQKQDDVFFCFSTDAEANDIEWYLMYIIMGEWWREVVLSGFWM